MEKKKLKQELVETGIHKLTYPNGKVAYSVPRRVEGKQRPLYFQTYEQAVDARGRYVKAMEELETAKAFINTNLESMKRECDSFPYNIYSAVFGDDDLDPIESQIALSRIQGGAFRYLLECRLDERSRHVVEELYVNGKTLREVGEDMGLTRERVRQIALRAVLILKAKPNKSYLSSEGEGLDRLNGLLKAAEDEFENMEYDVAKRICADYESKHLTSPQKRSIRVDEMGLSVRAQNALRRAGYETLADLDGITRTELLKIRNLGKRSTKEVEENLRERGIEVPLDRLPIDPRTK